MAFFSTRSADYSAAINNLKKPEYESKYNNLIENNMNKILNREDFSYDFNADPLFQNYKDNYTKLGKEAGMNAAASASALTGGYGNSYAGTAAAQANQQYLTQLNDRIPELYNAAMQKYNMETDNLYKQFGMLQSEENRLYGQHRDTVSDYYSDWGNLQSGFATAQAHEQWLEQMEYQKERDAVADSQWNKSFDYNAGRDKVSDSHWDSEFAYRQQRDAVADSQWERQFNLALSKARRGGSGGGSRSNSSGIPQASDNPYSTSLSEDAIRTYADNIGRNKNMYDTKEDIYNYLARLQDANGWDNPTVQSILWEYERLYG